jgi:hypothetical protein
MKKILDGIMNEDLPLVAGAVGAGFAKNLAGKVTSNEKLQAAAPFIAGLVLKRMKSPMIRFAGMGMIASSGRDLVGTFIPSIKGIEDMDLNGLFGDSITERVINEEMNDQVITDDVMYGDEMYGD